MGISVYFYLLLLSLIVMYMHRTFLRMLAGTTTNRLNQEIKEISIKATEVCEELEELSDTSVVVAVTAFIITVIFILLPFVYFGISLYLFRNPLFIILSIACISWEFYYLPKSVKFIVGMVNNTNIEKDYIIFKGETPVLLRNGICFTHALLVALFCVKELVTHL